MLLPEGRGWLGYCLNVHPTQTFEEVRAALLGPVREVRRRLCPDRPFGVGLRLSAEALAHPHAARELKAIFEAEGFAAYTMNGFPYGRFHGAPVKEAVYEPDWTARERLDYTRGLAEVMAALVPEEATATISTVPGAFAPRSHGREEAIAEGLLRAAADLVELRRRTGRTLALAIEPEPWCLMETVRDAVGFFRDRLFTERAARHLSSLTGLTADEAAAALPRHLGLCLDVCHMAVGFEEPEAALSALAEAGIPVHKLQLSAALRIDRMNGHARSRAAAFRDEVYLHQVVARAPGGALRRFLDLPSALERGDEADGEEWRIHFHVPVYAEPAPPLASTRDVLERVLALHRARPVTGHLEVETYTWDVLPQEALDGSRTDVVDGIEKELRWALQRLS
jgi:sugar phosphate isomerase/epimerase